jgi:hypothetical protein
MLKREHQFWHEHEHRSDLRHTVARWRLPLKMFVIEIARTLSLSENSVASK